LGEKANAMPSDADAAATVFDYHARTKHRFERMARSPGYLDWANQPDPFRRYTGAPITSLPLNAPDPALDYSALHQPAGGRAAPFDRRGVAKLLELSLGLAAWKALGSERWALRINPSSGNLHPTEAYLFSLQVTGIADGLYHYQPLTHSLARRFELDASSARSLGHHFQAPGLLVALSSVIWREAWKYGERAFRYCQLDLGHALAALRFAARLQGWRFTCLNQVGHAALARLLGFDRTAWIPLEEEEPELLCCLEAGGDLRPPGHLPPNWAAQMPEFPLGGHPHPLSAARREWAACAQVAAATRQPADVAAEAPPPLEASHRTDPADTPAAAVIRRRRSAVAFSPEGRMDLASFFRMLDATLPDGRRPPFDAAPGPARISLLLFVHQVTELAPGLYLFLRRADHGAKLRQLLSPELRWTPVDPSNRLQLLRAGDYRLEAIEMACNQEIAGFSVFSLAMLAEFQAPVSAAPWRYRQLFWEAGMIGQALYLEAEALGYRGTGIGCYFDDALHGLIGLEGLAWQDLYHFTVGTPVPDRRLQTYPPYAHLTPSRHADA
jgi:SagB-type dehydrogenase family enzyme